MAIIKDIAELIRDIGIIIGIPTIIIIAGKLYTQRIQVLKEQVQLLKETQYDRALSQIKSQKELYIMEREKLENEIIELKNYNKNISDELNGIYERIENIKNEEIMIENKIQIIKDLYLIYDSIFTDYELITDFKKIFFNKNEMCRSFYSGKLEIIYKYKDLGSKLEKFGLAEYNYENFDVMESEVTIKLNEKGIKLKEILFN